MPVPSELPYPTPSTRDGGAGWARLEGIPALVDHLPPARHFAYRGDMHRGHPVFATTGEDKVFREGDKWFYNGGWAGFHKLGCVDHIGGDPNLPPSGTGWTFCKDGMPSGFGFSIHPQFARRVEEAERLAVLGHSDDNKVKKSLAEKLAAHKSQLAHAEREKQAAIAAEDAAIAAAQRRRNEIEESHSPLIAKYKAQVDNVEQQAQAFKDKVTKNGLVGLDVAEVYEVLRMLGVNVDHWTLSERDWTGANLVSLSEKEMEDILHLNRLGERRRLAAALERLDQGKGFDKPASSQWDTARVAKWLESVGLASLSKNFQSCAIDGEALTTLTEGDLGYFGVDTPAGKTKVMSAIGKLKREQGW